MSRLLSIKTGGCAEDCGYCSQSAHHASGLKAIEADGGAERVLAEAPARRRTPAPRATAWAPPGASPKARDMDALVAMVEGVKALGMETCMTLGMLSDDDVGRLQGRRPRLLQPQHRYVRALLRQGHHHAHLRRPPATRWTACARPASRSAPAASSAWARSAEDRVDMLVTLANLAEHPESVPINMLIAIPGHAARRTPRRSTASTSCAPSRSPAS